jgi:hypothetical protein
VAIWVANVLTFSLLTGKSIGARRPRERFEHETRLGLSATGYA